MKKTISIMLAVWVLLALCACGGKAEDKAESPAAYDSKSGYGARESTEGYMQSEYEALLDYAKRLEEAGNYEAAQQVYALLPKAVAGAAVADIEAGIADTTYGKYFAGMQNLNKWEDLIKSVGDAQ